MPLPELANFLLSEQDKAAVTEALTQTKYAPWSVKQLACSPEVKETLNSLKGRLKDFHLTAQKNFCCYCRVIMNGDVSFIADREHILPKKKFRQYSYEIWNISVSCKRCNISFKKQKTNFVVGIETITDEPLNTDRYKFVHPNLDCWKKHLNRRVEQDEDMQLVFYKTKTDKGIYTKEFFNLSELECNTFDEAQGAIPINSEAKEFIRELPPA